MKKIYILICLILICLIAVVVMGLRYAFYQGYIRMNYPSFTDYPVQGIDVSHHQRNIDWEKLNRQAVQFVFIKATEGGNHKDSLFQENWRQARDHDIPSGAYHFFTFCKDGDEQARNYIHYVPRDSIDLPPIVDLEYGGNCMQANWKQDILMEVGKYVDIIEDHYQQKVIIYTTNEFYKNYLIDKFPDNPIWIRDILSKPNLPGKRKWLFWQYTNRGELEGVSTPVDLNAFIGSKDEFEKLRRIKK